MAASHRRPHDLPSTPAQTFSSQEPLSLPAVPSATRTTSPHSAARLKLVSDRGLHRRAAPPISMLPDILRALLWRAIAPLRIVWRRNWLYRQFLDGRLADRIRH